MSKTGKKLGIIDSIVLSDYVLYVAGAMSHLKLQKILYYIQAYHLAYFEQPIIEDDFQAWVHGPVSRKIYNAAKDLSILYNEIKYVQGKDEIHVTKLLNELTEDQVSWVDEIIKEYGTLTGPQLEALSHSEDPWIHARRGYGPAERCEEIIPKQSMQIFYRIQLYGAA